MNSDEQVAVKSAVNIFRGAQGPLDREYEERQRGPSERFGRLYSQEQVELNARRADEKLGTILVDFSQDQFAEYMRLTTIG
jgi:hypothetical protein